MSIDTKRSFIIGEQWLYYKIYVGPNTADLILGEMIKPIADYLLERRIIDKWFFIRYADPKEHLRVRFHVINVEYVGELINVITPYFKNLVEKDLIWKIQTDTYHREIERYGTNTMIESESLFFHDSVMISSLINMIEGDEGEEIRWLFGLKAIKSLLNSFGYTEGNKIKLMNTLKVNFRREYSESKILNNQLKTKYREKRKKIEEFMAIESSGSNEYKPLLDILNKKEKTIFPIVNAILNKRLEKSLDDLLSSYIHMLMNRLFKSKNRVHEMVCYNFLHRYYISVNARNKESVKETIV